MAIEVVFLVPVLFLFTLLVVAGGRYVSTRADVDAAARDAARAASLQHDYASAATDAAAAMRDSLSRGDTRACRVDRLGGDFESGGVAEVKVHCTVDLSDLGLLGMPGSLPVDGDGHAPIDTYRSTR